MPSSSSTPGDRYLQLIDNLLTAYLQGKFPSIPLLEQALAAELQQLKSEVGMDRERLESSLTEREQALQSQMDNPDEMTRAKAERTLRGLKVIEKAWEQLALETQTHTAISAAVMNIAQAEDPHQALLVLVKEIDQNRNPVLTTQDIKQLSVALKQKGQNSSSSQAQSLEHLATGLTQGLTACSRLQVHVMGWIFDAPKKLESIWVIILGNFGQGSWPL